MKHIYIIIGVSLIAIIFLSINCGFAQNVYEIPLSNPGKKGLLKVKVYDNPIKVLVHSSPNVIVEFHQKNKPSNGKKYVITPNMMEFDFTENQNEVTIFKRSGKRVKNVDIYIKVPKNFSVDLYTYFGDYIEVSDVEGEVKLNNYFGNIIANNIVGNIDVESFKGKVIVNEIIGSAIVNNSQGLIRIKFRELSEKYPNSITSNKGKIEVILHPSTKTRFLLDTYYGKISSDFQLQIDPLANTKIGKGKLKRKPLKRIINGGGKTNITIRNYFGDIYLKKEE